MKKPRQYMILFYPPHSTIDIIAHVSWWFWQVVPKWTADRASKHTCAKCEVSIIKPVAKDYPQLTGASLFDVDNLILFVPKESKHVGGTNLIFPLDDSTKNL